MGIALVGPWLTGMVGLGVHRAGRGAAAVLAGRRLQDDPRGSFGAIAGVIMAVFVASAFFTFVGYARGEARETQDPLLREGRVVAYVGSASTSTGGIDDRVATLAGVRSVVAVREASLRTADGIESYGWVADCPRLIATLGLAAVTCSPEGVTVINVGVTPGTYRLSSTIGGEPAAPPGFTVTIGEGAPLLDSGGELMGYLPPVVVDPAALGGPGAVAALPITRIYAATDGGELVVERILTAIVQTLPTASVQGAGDVVAGSETYAEIGRIVSLGLIGTLALAGCSLAVAVMTATLDRRRQFVFLRSTGMPVSGLHATILLQAAAPLIVVAAFSGLLGVVVGMVVLSVAGAPVVAFPDPALLLTLALSLAVAMGIVALTLPPLERLTRPAAVRHE
jgi:hypothetical protein